MPREKRVAGTGESKRRLQARSPELESSECISPCWPCLQQDEGQKRKRMGCVCWWGCGFGGRTLKGFLGDFLVSARKEQDHLKDDHY